MSMGMPDSREVYTKLYVAIKNDQLPQLMLYEFLSSGSTQANILANVMLQNKDALKLLTSPQGRKWVHKWLDDTLNYLQKFAGP